MQRITGAFRSMVLFGAVLWGQAVAGEAPEHVEGATTVNAAQAIRLHEQGAVFIDIRTQQEWNWGHLEGARHLGLKSTFALLYRDGFMDRKTPVVIYGNGAHRARAAFASRLAVLWGYEKVFYFREGYFSWLAFDLPVVMLSNQQ